LRLRPFVSIPHFSTVLTRVALSSPVRDKKEKKEKKEKKTKKEAGDEGEANGSAPAADADSGSGSDDEDDDDDDDDDVKWSTDTSAAAAAARAAEQLTDGAAAMVTVTAVKAAGASVDDAAKRLAGVTVAAEDDGDEDDDPLVIGLRAFAATHGAADVAAHLKGLQADNNEHRMHILVAALLDSAETAPVLSKQVAAKAAVLKACVPDAPSAGAMLASLERWVVDDAPHVLASKQGIATGLNALYDADVADEPAILAWADNVAAARKFGVSPDDAKAVRKAAAPFVEWLRTAESDEEDDE
jgi:translation initiation factor 5